MCDDVLRAHVRASKLTLVFLHAPLLVLHGLELPPLPLLQLPPHYLVGQGGHDCDGRGGRGRQRQVRGVQHDQATHVVLEKLKECGVARSGLRKKPGRCFDGKLHK